MGERGKSGRALRRARTLPLLATLLPSGWRNDRPPQGLALAALSALSALWTFLAVEVSSTVFPPAFQILSLLAGGLLLEPPRLRVLTGVSAACLGVEVAALGWHDVGAGTLIVVAVTAFACYEFARSREQTGLGAFGGENVLLELRERLQQQGRLPPLPGPWHGEAVVRPAGEAPFAGDFVVSACTGDGFEVALVDVSGKGVAAGTRALLLSGALGGLLGGGDPQAFLSAANAYLLRQRWDEGFATAVHVCVNLRTGSVAIASAGHPPVGRFDAGSGRWSLVQVEGVALGLLEGTTYDVARSQLDPGDALLLYTDGLVEVPGRDLSDGIDKLLGEAERLVSQGYRGGVEALLTRVAGASTDDRGLVLVRRR
ncbi:MAG: serine phosphatase [Frankiales bacterium]|nr:serine phosphatase [Frankiales bacterium]